MAADRKGMQILTGHWRRPNSKQDDIAHNEMGMTRVLLEKGHNIAALQVFWRGHDFRDVNSTQRKCGSGQPDLASPGSPGSS